MNKIFTLIALIVLMLSFGVKAGAVTTDSGLSSALVFDRVVAEIESDSRWNDASIDVEDLDLSSLTRNGKESAIKGFDSVNVEYLGQIRPGKRLTIRLVFSKEGQALTDVIVTARIRVYKDVVVAMRSLRIRDKVGMGDVRIERMELREIDAPVFISVSDVIGMRVRRPIRAGAYVKRNYIDPETLIRRGESVIVVAENGLVKIRTKARALEDGFPGSVVEARTAGGKVIFGTVTKSGELSVSF